MKNRLQKRNRRGFTLVELLMALIIFSILAHLLLPTLKRSKEQARRIICLNNTKEMALAFEMYKVNNNDWYPPCGWDFIEGEDWTLPYWMIGSVYGPCWLDAISPYIEWNENIFICPSDPDPGDFEWFRYTNDTAYDKCSYAANEDLLGIDNFGNEGSGSEGRVGGDSRKIKTVPSRLILVIDADYLWVNAQGGGWGNNLLNRVLYHHQDGLCAAFCDGHAEWIKKEDLGEYTLDPGCLW